MITENNIPKKFKIANQWYTIEIVDSIDGGNFGDFDCVRARIRLARNIYSCEEYVKVRSKCAIRAGMKSSMSLIII